MNDLKTDENLLQKTEAGNGITLLSNEHIYSIPRGSGMFNGKTTEFVGSTFGKKPATQKFLSPPKTTHSRSVEDLKHQSKYSNVDDSENVQNVYLDVNGYKTFFAVCDESPYSSTELKQAEPVYTWEYDGETLKALSKVTKKFDSFRMRKLKAKYFSGGIDAHANGSDKENVERHHDNSFTESKECNDFNKVSSTASKLLEENRKDVLESPITQNQPLLLSQAEKDRIEFFYSSLYCEIYVAGCMVDVLARVGANNSVFQEGSGISPYRWVQVWVGVPLLALNLGSDRKPRSLSIVVSQRDTGMTLWSERVTYATDYRQVENDGLHVLNESGSAKRALKIRWSDWDCAKAFIERFRLLTADRNDPLWTKDLVQSSIGVALDKRCSSKPFKRHDVKKHKRETGNAKSNCKTLSSSARHESSNRNNTTFSESSRRVTKENISLPFNLRVVTKVDSKDINFRSTFAGLLPMPHNKKNVYATLRSEDFRPRLPTH